MAILKIARMGHPVLSGIASPVRDPTAPEIKRLVADMIETTQDANGAGLAAPQVHVSRRVVVYGVPGDPAHPDVESVPLTILINPQITPVGSAQEEDWEGCLSVPDLRGMVPRWRSIRVQAFGRDGAPLAFAASGFHARVVQHECDHLDGMVYLDRMTSMETLTFLPEFHRYWLGREQE